MKKTLITLLALAGVAVAADVQSGFTTTFSNCAQSDATAVTLTNTWILPDASTNTITGSITSLTKTGTSESVSLKTSGDIAQNATYFTPDSNVGSGSPWTTTITYSNVDWTALNGIHGITLDLVMYNSSGGKQGSGTNGSTWSGDVSFTVTLANNGTEIGKFTGNVFEQMPDSKGWDEAVKTITLSGDNVDVSALTGDLSVTIALTETLNNGCYFGVESITYIPEPATATLSLLALCGLATRRRRK